MKLGETVLLIGKNESYVITVLNDFHTKSGVISKKDLLKRKIGQKIKTHLGKEFLIIKPTVNDLIERRFKRGAQVILPKDISLILAYTGINPDSTVVDAGTGSGYTSIFLGNYMTNGKVITYEKDKRFVKISNHNIKISGLKNVRLKNRDISKGIQEKNVDLINLDLQNPHKIIKRAYNALKIGGWLSVYCPTVDEMMKVSKEIMKYKFSGTRVVENIVREWQTERTTRPKTMGLMHTGFLIFTRKMV